MIESFEAQKIITGYRDKAIVVATMTANFEWPQVSLEPDLDLLFSGAMGKASSVGLGLALAMPEKKVIILDGDGSLLMNLGSLVTIANLAPNNLIHFLFENSRYRTSGNQFIPGAGKVNFSGLAKAAGYRIVYNFKRLEQLETGITRIMNQRGPIFICLSINPKSGKPPFQFTPTKDIIDRFRAAMRGNDKICNDR